MISWPKVSVNVEKGLDECFGCGKDNPIGLKLNFTWDGKTVKAEFNPKKLYQGWAGIVHGGIIMCLLDEAMTYASYFQGISAITARMQVRLQRPALLDRLLVITSTVTKRNRKLIETQATITFADGTPVAEGTATHFIVDNAAWHAGKNGGAQVVPCP